MKWGEAFDKVQEVNEVAWSFYHSNPVNDAKRNMNPEIKLLIQNLGANNVRYLLIGGFAMAFYGHVRATTDIDLWIENTPENMLRLREALIQTGLTEARALQTTTQLVPGFSIFNFLESDFKIDLMHHLKKFKETDFKACYLRASDSDYSGVIVKVINASDLLEEKTANSRAKDQTDINFLRQLIGKIFP